MVISTLLLVLLAPEATAREAEDKAQQALTAGNVAEALDFFEAALRASDSTEDKARLRDLYREAGWAEPRPINQAERFTIDVHIRNERIRVLSTKADDIERRGQLRAAIILRRALTEMAGGPGSERGKQEQEKIASLTRRLTEKPSAEEQELVSKLVRSRKTGASLLKAARKLLDERQFKVVVRLCQEIMFGQFDQDTQNDAIALRKEAEAKAVSDITPLEKNAARNALDDERFDRLAVERSRHFLFIGPRTFVESIPNDQRQLLDLAYIYQSDLSATHLTANNVRLCVYYQETFDFGGGLAGGKLIRIGNRAIRLPIAGMLHYHELGHCIFGKGWLHHGFTEGLADFAAGFTLDALGQTREAREFIVNARDQFVRYFLGRDVRYFDIQPYRPSAGFLFNFLPPGEAPYDWAPFRQAFHAMRDAQFGSWPSREHQLMRFFGTVMSTVYGPRAYDTLAEWGWPVARADKALVPAEAEHLLSAIKQAEALFDRGMAASAEPAFAAILDERKAGWLAARARYGLLRCAAARRDESRVRELKATLGILDQWRILGPYHARRRTKDVFFPMETVVDLRSERIRWGNGSAVWKDAKPHATGAIDFKAQGYGYPQHACAFARTYVHVDQGGPARVWIGSDDGHALYVNSRLAEKRPTARGLRFDDDFADVELEPGWNRVLVKVHNSSGAWGFLARITDRAGHPLPGLRISTKDAVEEKVPKFKEPRRKSVGIVSDDFKSLRSSRWFTGAGKWDTRNGRLRPLGTAKIGLWQRFVVDPDKPKDGPANILWLRSPELARADSLEVELVVVARGADGLPAKFGLTIDGENENDGQSGHTLVFDANDEAVRCHWYRYDHLLFLRQAAAIEPAATYRVRVRRIGSKWWVTVNEAGVFEFVDAGRLPAFGLGILTWGNQPEIESIKVTRLAPAP